MAQSKKISSLVSTLGVDLGNIAIHGTVTKKVLKTRTGKHAIDIFSTKDILPSNAKGTLNALADKTYSNYNWAKEDAINEYVNNDLMNAIATWVSMGDDVVRFSHTIDNQIKFSESKIGYELLSGVETNAPRDSGVEEEDYGCRCWEDYKTSSEKDEEFSTELSKLYKIE